MRVLAIDPGETSAYVVADVVESQEFTTVDIIKAGQWQGMRQLALNLNMFNGVTQLVMEDYLIYPNRAQSHIGDRVFTAREIGRIEWIALYHCSLSESEGSVVFQMASQAKQRWPNARLRNYVRYWATPHIGDAIRHLLTLVEVQFGDPMLEVRCCKEVSDHGTN